jgi:hypothetical protein
MIITIIKLFYNVSFTICFLWGIVKVLRGLRLFTINELINYYGKGSFICVTLTLFSLNLILNLKSGLIEDFNLENGFFSEQLTLIHENMKNVFELGSFFNSLWNSMVEYIMIVIFCKRQFTLNSSFYFALSILIKNLHLLWIQNFRSLEVSKGTFSFRNELINIISFLFTINLEIYLSKIHIHFSKRRLANCVVSSEIVSIVLILKGLCVNKFFSLLNSTFEKFDYNQLHCFYLRIVIFSLLSISHLLSLINLGLTKKVIFKFYVCTRIFQSTKELIENFTELNRFRKMTINLNNSMSSPTEEELQNLSDHLCIICRDEITPETSKKLHCGHIFHIVCLQNWMIRQYCCPTCLTVISSKSKNHLRDVDRISYETNRAKIDLISLLVGCAQKTKKNYSNRPFNMRTTSLPPLEPDLTSIVFSKVRSFQTINFKRVKSESNKFLSTFEKLLKIRTFILENFVIVSNFNQIKNNYSQSKKLKSFVWKGESSIDTIKNLQKITCLIANFS